MTQEMLPHLSYLSVLPFLTVCHGMIALLGMNEERCNLSQPTQPPSLFSMICFLEAPLEMTHTVHFAKLSCFLTI